MNDLAKILIISGVLLFTLGIYLLLFGRIPGLGRLPGDIFIKKNNFTFYFPITTCLLISALITGVFILWNRK